MQLELLASIDGQTRGNLMAESRDVAAASSTNDHIEAHEQAKKPTRQWAAWTRQEEESFFCALRQVGKNFEKITCRVQSKNKDQVRHYYYRLVRRMNKLLGPELGLDAKNSKDTNAAMLRWWSLLEKYSCNVSKLHLKPRRYKIFVEALENQLLKYRKKNDRKKSQGGNSSPSPSMMTNHSRASAHDGRSVRLVLVDSQNTQKLSPSNPPSKHASNVGKYRANAKADLTSMKPPRRRQKSAVGSTAAYKKWEEAAIAGVSLVADAAEHLESSAAVKDVENEPPQKKATEVPSSVQVISPTPLVESNLQAYMKFKLQLFPLDNITRRALEVDNHNPHLELTLGSRKKISSIVEHLNRKWGSSSVASGELMLFPYNTQNENILMCQRWTQRSTMSAADVYIIVGSPEVFRLRYGWVSESQSVSGTAQACIQPCCRPKDGTMPVNDIDEQTAKLRNNRAQNDRQTDQFSMIQTDCPSLAYPATGFRKRRALSPLNDDLIELSDNAVNSFCSAVVASDEVVRQPDNEDELRLSDNIPPSAGEWADSLTDISIGGLLDVSICNDMSGNCFQAPIAEIPRCIPQSSFTCDSFDAAIAAHISRYQNKLPYESTLSSHESSIWEAEETCDAFSFRRNIPVRKDRTTPSSTSSDDAVQQSSTDPVSTKNTKVESRGMLEIIGNHPSSDLPVDMCMLDNQHILDNSAPEALRLTDIYWVCPQSQHLSTYKPEPYYRFETDSLGPLDLDMPSSKYHCEHFILSDSLSGLNCLMANSLDSFPSCSIFGIENKESGSTVEA